MLHALLGPKDDIGKGAMAGLNCGITVQSLDVDDEFAALAQMMQVDAKRLRGLVFVTDLCYQEPDRISTRTLCVFIEHSGRGEISAKLGLTNGLAVF